MTNPIPEQLAAAHKANLDASIAFASLVFAGLERFAPLALNAARDTLEGAADASRQLAAARTPQDLAALGNLSQPTAERLAAYIQEAYEIAASNRRELGALVDAQVDTLNSNLSSTLDGAARNAPVGSEVLVAAVKTLMGAANAAFESINKAAQQAGDMADANLKAAAEAGQKLASASQAVAPAAPKARARK